ncbi:hypothetical protein [Corynebacterium appendicis]|nr:hypothetical protein [Corynebacterium appendicis]
MSILFSRRRALALVLAFVLAVTATIVPAVPSVSPAAIRSTSSSASPRAR